MAPFLATSGSGHWQAGDRVTAVRYAGVNLSGGEFGSGAKVDRYGFSYIYPTAKDARPFLAAGMNVVRLPVRWKRLQPKVMGPLSGAEMHRIDALIKAMAGFSLIIIDLHDFGGRDGKRLDQREDGAAILADFWIRIADRYKADPAIAFGIMNEPYGMSAWAWRAIADRSVAAIRARGARNLILVPGTRWSGAHSWTKGGDESNAAAFADFTDPANHYLFEMHQYADRDSSGTHEQCVVPATAAENLEAATTWLRHKGAQGFLGEFGVAANANCLAALDAMLDMMARNQDVWAGWTYWSAGPWWGSYGFNLQPDEKGDKPQWSVVRQYIPKRTSGLAKNGRRE